jgi:hypothetical protein
MSSVNEETEVGPVESQMTAAAEAPADSGHHLWVADKELRGTFCALGARPRSRNCRTEGLDA